MVSADDEVLRFFRSEDTGSEPCLSLQFLNEHPSLLQELDVAVRDPNLEELPSRVGSFQIQDVLGRGGMAVVVRATDTSSEQTVALKLVPVSNIQEAQSLRREARVLDGFEHPHVVKFVGHGETQEWCWIALELVEGQTLADWISSADARKNHPPQRSTRVSTVMAWFKTLAEGLAALHDAGSVHRDIKPANVLIRQDGSPCLIDFGLAQGEASEPWGARVLAGTVPYMSPEQTLAGLVAIDRTSDVYSLAATMYEALCSHRTVDGTDRSRLLLDVAFSTVVAPSRFCSEIPSKVDAIFARALSKNRANRYADARELAADVAAFLADKPLVHAAEKLPSRVWNSIRTRPRRAAAAVTAVVFAASCWGYVVHAANHQRSTQLATIDKHLQDGDDAAALDVISTTLESSIADPVVVQFCQTRSSDLADAVASLTMEELGFFVAGVSQVQGLEKRAKLAAALDGISSRHEYRFAIGIHDFIAHGARNALQQLEADDARVQQSALLLELRAVMQLEQRDFTAFLQTKEHLQSMPSNNLRLSSLVFRAYRMIRTAASARAGAAPLAAERERCIEDATQLAKLAVSNNASGPFAATCEALAAMEGQSFELAAKRFGALADLDQQRTGSELFAVLAEALHLSTVTNAHQSRIKALAQSSGVHPATILHWLSRNAHGFGSLPVAVAFAQASPAPPTSQVVSQAEFAFALVCDSAKAAAWEDCGALGAHLLPWIDDNQDPQLVELVGAAHSLATWAGIYRLQAALKNPEQEHPWASAVAQQVRDRSATALERDLGSKLDALAAGAIANLYEARLITDPSRRVALQNAGSDQAADLLKDREELLAAELDQERRTELQATLEFVEQSLAVSNAR